MPTSIVFQVFLPGDVTYNQIELMRQSFVADFGLNEDDLVAGPILQFVAPGRYPKNVDIPAGSTYLDLNITDDYYGIGYERGDIRQIVRWAEWFDANAPGSVVYYGNDCSPDSVEKFDQELRDKLLAHHRENPTVYHDRHMAWLAEQGKSPAGVDENQ